MQFDDRDISQRVIRQEAGAYRFGSYRRSVFTFGKIAAIIPIVLTALLVSLFFKQARTGEGYRASPLCYPFSWQAHWIRGGDDNARSTCFRYTFNLDGNVKSGYLAVAADNFAAVRVNGGAAGSFFMTGTSTAYVGGQMETPNSEIGNRQFNNWGQIYNIAPKLHPGINVITVQAESDRGAPAVLIQGAIKTNNDTSILTDQDWKYSQIEQRTATDWTSPHFDDSTWQQAAVTPGPLDLPVDGDPAVFTTLPTAAVIGANTPMLSSEARFTNTISCPDEPIHGYLRMVSTVPYDLSLNGRHIVSASLPAEGVKGTFSRFKSLDVLVRSRLESREGHVVPQSLIPSMSVYLLDDVFLPGKNTLEVTLHDQNTRIVRTIPTFYLDGQINGHDGWNLNLGSDSNWQAAAETGFAQWTPARTVAHPLIGQFGYAKPGLAGHVSNRLWELWQVAINGLFLLAGFLLLIFAVVPPAKDWTLGGALSKAARAGIFFLLPAVVLMGFVCIQAVFAFSSQALFFFGSTYGMWALLSAVAAALIVPIGGRLGRPRCLTPPETDAEQPTQPVDLSKAPMGLDKPLVPWATRLKIYGPAVFIGLLMLLDLYLCVRGIDDNPFLNDEYVSILCARGILRTGLPIYEVSGVIYGRSALYHYLLAPFVALGYATGHLGYTRLLSGIWQLAMLPLIYVFGREIKGRAAGLTAAALIAVSPYFLYYAREARFYSQFAFFSTLMFYLLLRSIRNPDKPGYRIGTILAFCAAYLSQQLALSTIPAALLIILLSHQTMKWLRGSTLAALGGAMAVIVVDLFVYFKYCVTPLPFVDRDSMPLLAVHTDNLDVLPTMVFLNYERVHLPLTVLFFVGLIWEIARSMSGRPSSPRWRWSSYLYLVTLLTLALLTLLVPIAGSRYAVGVVPPFYLAAACALVQIVKRVIAWARVTCGGQLAARYASVTVASIAALLLLAADRPVRVLNSLDREMHRDHTTTARFVATHMIPGDKIMFFNPQAAMVEVGRCDYNWSTPLKALYKYVGDDGRLRERDSGAVVIDNVDKLQRVVADNPRVWLVSTPLGGGDMSAFAKLNFQLVYESYGMQVWLWDQSSNRYRRMKSMQNYETLLY